jgi:predicted Zn-dependent peptidase
MMTLDRTIQPPIRPISDVVFKEPQRHVLPNGLKLYSLSEGAQEVIRIDLVFNSGTSSVDNATAGPAALLAGHSNPLRSSR